jgi:CubicO group peptidase (beta-lactamase class C family)
VALLSSTLVALILSGRGGDAQAPPATGCPDPAALDAYFTQAARDWTVPGFAVAIVKDDRVVLVRGYGVREVGASAPVDEHTVFYTGSVTKQFTVAALALLAGDGKLRIDDQVTKYLPSFALVDPSLTGQVTVRDLLAHRTGLPRADLLMFGGYEPLEIMRRLRFVKPIAPLRTQFTYQNQMYLVAGELIPALAGRSWSDFLEERLLKPIGMTDGNARGFGGAPGTNVATPAARLDGAVRSLTVTPRPGYGAGGVNASAADLSRWLRLLVAGGTIDGTKLLDPAVVGAMTSSQTIARPMAWTPGANFATYGLGWFLHDYRGRKVAQHGGSAEGWSAAVGLLPDAKLGVGIVSNMNGSALPYALMFRVFDACLGEPATDWSARFLELERRSTAGAPSAPANSVPASAPPLEPFAGAYGHPVYGTARLTVEGGRLVFRYGPQMTGHLAFERDDVFRADWLQDSLRVLTGRPVIRFRRGAAGIDGFVLELADGKIEFVRVAE